MVHILVVAIFIYIICGILGSLSEPILPQIFLCKVNVYYSVTVKNGDIGILSKEFG